jgi:ferritin-like metal-binding protein YciE
MHTTTLVYTESTQRSGLFHLVAVVEHYEMADYGSARDFAKFWAKKNGLTA